MIETQQGKLKGFGQQYMREVAKKPDGLLPPHSLELEASVLADLLDHKALGAGAWDAVKDILRPEDFWSEAHRAVFDAVSDLHGMRAEGDDRTIGPVEVLNWVKANNFRNVDMERFAIGDLGKVQSVFDYAHASDRSTRVEKRANDLRALGDKRKLIESLWDAAAFGYREDNEAFQLALAGVMKQAEALSAPRGFDSELMIEPARRVFHKYLAVDARPADDLITTGFPDVDRITSLQPGQLVVVGARSGRGKSSLSMQLAMHVGDSFGQSLFFSTEMSGEELTLRAMCSKAKVDSKKVRRAQLSQPEYERLIEATNHVQKTLCSICDKPGLDVVKIGAIATRECARIMREHKKPVRLIVVDYLQRISAGRVAEPGANRERQVAAIAQYLKELARKLNVCVVVPAQLNADADKRDDERPRASDLRESKAIEQEADTVLLIHNPHYNARQREGIDLTEPEDCEIILAKGRADGMGMATVWFTPAFTSFTSMTESARQALNEKREREANKQQPKRRAA